MYNPDITIEVLFFYLNGASYWDIESAFGIPYNIIDDILDKTLPYL